MSQILKLIPTSGPGSGTVTSISQGIGIELTPNPITTAGTVSVSPEVALEFTTDDTLSAIPTANILFIQGAGGITTSSSGDIVTITGSGAAGIAQIDGDVGFVTGSTVSIKGQATSGETVIFDGSGAAMTLDVTDSNFNTTIGLNAGYNNMAGNNNTSLGYQTLTAVNSGDRNVAIGSEALKIIDFGVSNTAIGYQALEGLVGGAFNIALGDNAGSLLSGSESDNIYIGNLGVNGESATIRIGDTGDQTATYIAGIDTVNVGSVAKVVTMASDRLGTATITAGTGIMVTPTANTITIAATGGGGGITLTGDTGGALGPASAFNIIGATGGQTVAFNGSGTTLNLSTNDANFNCVIGDLSAATGGTSFNTYISVGGLLNSERSVAIGRGAAVIGGSTDSIAIGFGSAVDTSTSVGSIVLGSISTAVNDGSIVIGNAISDTSGSGTYIAGIAGISVPNTNMVTIDTTTGQLGSTAVASLFSWSVISADQAAIINNGYFCNKAGTLALTLPATSAVGDVIEVSNINTATGIQFIQAAGQQIFIGNTSTTSGATGTLTSSVIGDSLKIVCSAANLTWRVVSGWGNWTPT